MMFWSHEFGAVRLDVFSEMMLRRNAETGGPLPWRLQAVLDLHDRVYDSTACLERSRFGFEPHRVDLGLDVMS